MLPVLLVAHALPATALEARDSPFDFGDDSSEYSNDNECDDMRFTGPGMTETPLLLEDIGADASDCRAAFFERTIRPHPLFLEPKSPRDIVWGDDAGEYPRDGECDDLRFTGYYAAAMEFFSNNVGHDATDCRGLFARGVARWRGANLNR